MALRSKTFMAIIAKANNFEKAEPIAEGAYPARVYQVLHIGTVKNFLGDLKNMCRITFEFPTELGKFTKEGKEVELPMVLSTNDLTLSFHEKATLRKLINACDPQGIKIDDNGFMDEYDIENLIGKTCLVTVNHEKSKQGDVYARMHNWTVLPKAMTCPDAVNEPKILAYDKWDENLFQNLPKFLRDKIETSLEYMELKGTSTVDDFDMKAPF